MQRLLANASWTLYISDKHIPTLQKESRFVSVMRQIHRRLFGPELNLLVVIEKDHPLVVDYISALIETTVKKFSWDHSGRWLFLTVETHGETQLEELKDQFILISGRHASGSNRGKLECVA